jgi:hypothetical protein
MLRAELREMLRAELREILRAELREMLRAELREMLRAELRPEPTPPWPTRSAVLSTACSAAADPVGWQVPFVT